MLSRSKNSHYNIKKSHSSELFLRRFHWRRTQLLPQALVLAIYPVIVNVALRRHHYHHRRQPLRAPDALLTDKHHRAYPQPSLM